MVRLGKLQVVLQTIRVRVPVKVLDSVVHNLMRVANVIDALMLVWAASTADGDSSVAN